MSRHDFFINKRLLLNIKINNEKIQFLNISEKRMVTGMNLKKKLINKQASSFSITKNFSLKKSDKFLSRYFLKNLISLKIQLRFEPRKISNLENFHYFLNLTISKNSLTKTLKLSTNLSSLIATTPNFLMRSVSSSLEETLPPPWRFGGSATLTIS
ncbi:hypothetical protein BpHYR1_025565 [Brachionus plicatilis]|uniref:Uncharacterized protein n=1 Tax=Brachionus plicatilis TaxID=10195 RepID=A0A3M7Q3H1_BRAPC|nr:hypothetical protein BpHYR1_025565 [Brachionus plicatilis]